MMERVEENFSGSFLPGLIFLVLFQLLFGALKWRFSEPVAAGLAGWSVALLCYRFSPFRKAGFLKWALVSLSLVVGYIGLIYGVFYPLRKPFGAVLTAGLMVFVLVLSFRFVDHLLRQKPKSGLWKWLAMSAGGGLLSLFLHTLILTFGSLNLHEIYLFLGTATAGVEVERLSGR
jgi:hypothetical protein